MAAHAVKNDSCHEAMAACKGELEKAKMALLDLSRRNPLLSFKHDKSRGVSLAIRAINTSIPALLKAFDSKESVPILPLPSPQEAQVQGDGQKPADVPGDGEDALGVEGDVQAGSSQSKQIKLADYAASLGIDPNFDLGDRNAPATDSSKGENVFQTLLLPEDFDRILKRLTKQEEQFRQEKGVHTLYIAFGFLKWYEREDSQDEMLSPLLLLPIYVQAERDQGEMHYDAIPRDEGLVVNLVLSKRLERDFDFVLPAYEPGHSVVDYLQNVEKQLRKKRSAWSVISYVTIGLFPFARLAMYEDLQGNDWSSPIQAQPLLLQLFGGGDSEQAYVQERDYDLDSDKLLREAPYLFLDADSSQHSAILDALSGDNLVIQGPPGTGKSQTITNIIASMLSAGKSVLFVAEKQAALQVVAKRLENIGLGDFCLNLHSDENKKSFIVDSLRKRIERMYDPQRQSSAETTRQSYNGTLEELQHTRQRLKEYKELMATPAGKSGESIHNLIWRFNRHALDTQPSLKGGMINYIDHAEEIEKAEYQQFVDDLGFFEKAVKEIRRYGRPGDHPWAGVDNDHIGTTDLNDVQAQVEMIKRDISDLAQDLQALHIPDLDTSLTIGQVEDALKKLSGLALPQEDVPNPLYRALVQDGTRTVFISWFQAVMSFWTCYNNIAALVSVDAETPFGAIASELNGAANIMRYLPPQQAWPSLRTLLTQRERLTQLLASLTHVIQVIASLLSWERPRSWEEFVSFMYQGRCILSFDVTFKQWLDWSYKYGFALDGVDFKPLIEGMDVWGETLEKLPQELPLASVTRWIVKRETMVSELPSFEGMLERLTQTLAIARCETPYQTQAFHDALALLNNRPVHAMKRATQALCASDGAERFEELTQRLSSLKEERAQIEKTYRLRNCPSSEELLKAADILREAGFWGFLQSSVRKARKTYKRVYKGDSKHSRPQQADKLEELAQYLIKEGRFRENASYKSLCGDVFEGVTSDLSTLQRACDWIVNVRRTLAPYGAVGRDLRDKLLQASSQQAQEFQVQLAQIPRPPEGMEYESGETFYNLVSVSKNFVKRLKSILNNFNVIYPLILCGLGILSRHIGVLKSFNCKVKRSISICRQR